MTLRSPTSSMSRPIWAESPNSSRDCGFTRTLGSQPLPAGPTKQPSHASSAGATGPSCSSCPGPAASTRGSDSRLAPALRSGFGPGWTTHDRFRRLIGTPGSRSTKRACGRMPHRGLWRTRRLSMATLPRKRLGGHQMQPIIRPKLSHLNSNRPLATAQSTERSNDFGK